MIFGTTEFRCGILSWFSKNKRNLPWRKRRNPYRVWVSEIMLQQTQVVTVIPYYLKWLRLFPTAEKLAQAPLEKVLKAWEGLGYYSRARNLRKGAQYVVSQLDGRIPKNTADLQNIPGIGPYTAGAIASIAYGQREPLVDGNVGRVFARLFKIPGVWNDSRTNKILWAKARTLVPEKRAGDFNEALMELGATVCAKENPLCPSCPVRKFCAACEEGKTALYPDQRKSPITPVKKIVLLIKKNGKVLVRRKKEGKIMGGLWEFPTMTADSMQHAVYSQKKKEFLGSVSHSYTRFKAYLDIFKARLDEEQLADPDFEKPRWVSLAGLETITFPSVYRKIAQEYLK